ncbi:hypothetical protein EDC01DRAFT_644092 [Geopyxis carbonaria]|nr:hypothetical protein EDC01DRAFT_683971 [Geopyxis carbonaria]KAI5803651.1 hypothetical protein EDC01DRAFT_644092 [Geopyxis carbonaria]
MAGVAHPSASKQQNPRCRCSSTSGTLHFESAKRRRSKPTPTQPSRCRARPKRCDIQESRNTNSRHTNSSTCFRGRAAWKQTNSRRTMKCRVRSPRPRKTVLRATRTACSTTTTTWTRRREPPRPTRTTPSSPTTPCTPGASPSTQPPSTHHHPANGAPTSCFSAAPANSTTAGSTSTCKSNTTTSRAPSRAPTPAHNARSPTPRNGSPTPRGSAKKSRRPTCAKGAAAKSCPHTPTRSPARRTPTTPSSPSSGTS